MDSESDQETFKIEGIIKKRIRNGITEYLIKWDGYFDSDNSWEKAENMRCPETVKQFEDKLKAETSGAADLVSTFEKGHTVEKIFGATLEKGNVFFFVKWAGMDKASFESSKDMNKYCPQLVIKFYEERLILKKEHIKVKTE